MTFSDGDLAELLRARLVSSSFFSLLGIRPVVGRDFTELDGRPGSPPTVIWSATRFWQQRLGGRPDVVGAPSGSMARTTLWPACCHHGSAHSNDSRTCSCRCS